MKVEKLISMIYLVIYTVFTVRGVGYLAPVYGVVNNILGVVLIGLSVYGICTTVRDLKKLA